MQRLSLPRQRIARAVREGLGELGGWPAQVHDDSDVSRIVSGMNPLVLVVDDDRKLVETLQRYLERAAFRVATAHSGAEAIAVARAAPPDLVILDVMLPRGDGIEVCSALRTWSSVPIIMLTARTAEDDRVRGLELGADDYVTKPFSPRELIARIRAILRRAEVGNPGADTLCCGTLTCDADRHEVQVSGVPIDVTPTQFRLLQALISSPGRTFRRRELAQRALLGGEMIDDRTVDAHIMQLRKRIDVGATPSRIVTVFGVGYKLVAR